ncbi:VF530 family DNA-binding protein [Psychromonas antarctica]|jgi:uncharacterized protein (DUF2132 family)|uniref:VF530 family protein n=1 Tax=Psychromonas antarctica TaxID=67573 RepID=UPI001EE86FC4|nr:VF530 family protein [Psychromonas antarctica]MCG6201995.1 VF530 family protein [Psychromonas antarctica]
MTNDNDPLHGVKLEQILTELERKLGWKQMGELLNINCFTNNPRLKSSLKFLRKTPWARSKVEILYLKTFFSDNKATGHLIRGLIAQKRATSVDSETKPDAFTWPTLKAKE